MSAMGELGDRFFSQAMMSLVDQVVDEFGVGFCSTAEAFARTPSFTTDLFGIRFDFVCVVAEAAS